MKLSLAL